MMEMDHLFKRNVLVLKYQKDKYSKSNQNLTPYSNNFPIGSRVRLINAVFPFFNLSGGDPACDLGSVVW